MEEQDTIQGELGDTRGSDSDVTDANAIDSPGGTDAKSGKTVPKAHFDDFRNLANSRYDRLDNEYKGLEDKLSEATLKIDDLNSQIKRVSEDESRAQKLERIQEEQRKEQRTVTREQNAKKRELRGSAWEFAGEYKVDAAPLLEMAKDYENYEVKDLEMKAMELRIKRYEDGDEKPSDRTRTIVDQSRPRGLSSDTRRTTLSSVNTHRRALEEDEDLAALLPTIRI